MSINLQLDNDSTFILSYIYDLSKFKTVDELIKINMSRAQHTKFITKEHVIMMEEVATELLKHDRFQIQGNNGGYCLIKKNEDIDGYTLNNILGISTILAKAQFISVPNIKDTNHIKQLLLNKFQELLKNNYVTMMVMFDPILDLHPDSLIHKIGFITRYGTISLKDKE